MLWIIVPPPSWWQVEEEDSPKNLARELMSERESGDYHMKHWYPAERSRLVLMPNTTRAIYPERPDTAKKAALLANKQFRKALSLSINRDEIIQTALPGDYLSSRIEELKLEGSNVSQSEIEVFSPKARSINSSASFPSTDTSSASVPRPTRATPI
ncbi:MAG: hypothetical protein ACOC54_03320 [Candidatus Sumerlaeota bacterium]